jgi:FkbM family methyltransferase
MSPEIKQLRQRVKQCQSAIKRRLALESSQGRSPLSFLKNKRSLMRHLAGRRQAKAAMMRLASLRNNQNTEVVIGLHGLFEVLASDTVVTPAMMKNLNWDFDVLARAVDLVETETGNSLKSATLLDIGANIGMVGIQMLGSGLMKRSISFEPDPTNFALLWSSVRLNALEDRFDLHACALGSAKGACQFEVSDTNAGDHRVRAGSAGDPAGEKYEESSRKVISVPMQRLDDLLDNAPGDFTRRIGLCWIDVQGFEAEVLRGGLKHFGTFGWPAVMEFWPYGLQRAGSSAAQIESLLSGIWSKFAVLVNDGPVKWMPVSHIRELWNSVGTESEFVDLLLMK